MDESTIWRRLERTLARPENRGAESDPERTLKGAPPSPPFDSALTAAAAAEVRPAPPPPAGAPTPPESSGSTSPRDPRTIGADGTWDAELAGEGAAAPGFALLEEIGRGGMGVIHRAIQLSLEREVAVKTMRKGRGAGAERRAIFAAEARVTGWLDHPNIVPVHELGHDADGAPFLAMKRVRGHSWKSLLRPSNQAERERVRDMTLERHLEILMAVCNAIAFAHARGVVHCDLKPANVMIGDFGEIYVMDWGIAVECSDRPGVGAAPGRHRSSVGELQGTPAYMAPEQAEGLGERIGPRTDVYLLGGILYEICERRPPHQGDSLAGYVFSAVNGDRRTWTEGSPEELRAICERALAVDPADRWPDVVGFQQALRDFLSHQESHAIERDAARRLELATSMSVAGGRDRALHYARLGEAVAGMRQARLLWPENDAAKAGEKRARLVLAAAAESSGDFRLALAQLESMRGDAEADAAAERIARSAAAREHGERSRRRLRRGLAAAAVVIAAVLLVGFFAVDAQRRRADDNARAAATEARRAEANATRWKSALDEVQRLSDVRRLRELRDDLETLHPVRPELVPELVRWLERAETLRANDDLHRAALTALRRRARPARPDEAARERRAAASERERFAAALVEAERLAREDESDHRSSWMALLPELRERLDALDRALAAPASPRFDDVQDAWRASVLTDHLAELASFFGAGGAVEDVARRLDFARSVRRRSIDEAASAWRRARDELADDHRFPGFRLEPVVGLVPLGADPHSGLQEFLHLETHEGEVPVRDARGVLPFDTSSGIVLVLMPGGRTVIGAQNLNPDAPRFDPMAMELEQPPTSVELDPYFFSKFEMTQAQWRRIAGNDPSIYFAGRELSAVNDIDATHPVEGVTWDAANALLERLGLELPTEARWEHAARAGTDGPWYTGDDARALHGRVNAADLAARRAGAAWAEIDAWGGLDDGFATHAPVHAFAPNPWGIFGVLGNVSEWTADRFTPNWTRRQDGDGRPAITTSEAVVVRGGSFYADPAQCRHALRESISGREASDAVGVRPCLSAVAR